MILSEKSNEPINDMVDDGSIKLLLEESNEYGSTLLVTDELISNVNIKQTIPSEIENIHGEYDSVIIHINKSIKNKSGMEVTKIFLDCIGHVRNGGLLFVPQLTYNAVPGGRKVIGGLIKTLKLHIEVPPSQYGNILIASKLNL